MKKCYIFLTAVFVLLFNANAFSRCNTVFKNEAFITSDDGVHDDGQQLQTNVSTVIYPAGIATSLSIVVSAENTAEMCVIYFNKNKATPIDGQTNASQTILLTQCGGASFDGLPTNYNFRTLLIPQNL